MSGYPSVALTSAGTVLSFRYLHGGHNPFVTDEPPALVELGGGRVAYFPVAKNVCPTQTLALADGLQVQLPGQQSWLALPGSALKMAIGYCNGVGSSFGNVIHVSPIEAQYIDVSSSLQA